MKRLMEVKETSLVGVKAGSPGKYDFGLYHRNASDSTQFTQELAKLCHFCISFALHYTYHMHALVDGSQRGGEAASAGKDVNRQRQMISVSILSFIFVSCNRYSSSLMILHEGDQTI